MNSWFKNPTNVIGALSWLGHIAAVGGAAYMQTNPKLAAYAPIVVAVAGQLPPVLGPAVSNQ